MRALVKCLLVGFLAYGGIAHAGEAQSFLNSSPQAGGARESWDFGTCIAKRDPDAARRALIAYLDKPHTYVLQRLSERFEACGTDLSYGRDNYLLAAALAEGVVDRSESGLQSLKLYLDTQERHPLPVTSFEELAICTWSLAPEEAVALLDTVAATPGEKKAAERLASKIAPCVPGVEASRLTTRGARSNLRAELAFLLFDASIPRAGKMTDE